MSPPGVRTTHRSDPRAGLRSARRPPPRGGADPISAALWSLSVDGLLVLATVGQVAARGTAAAARCPADLGGVPSVTVFGLLLPSCLDLSSIKEEYERGGARVVGSLAGGGGVWGWIVTKKTI